jgi:hypothetical protein
LQAKQTTTLGAVAGDVAGSVFERDPVKTTRFTLRGKAFFSKR